jgi:lysyl-tRNA synthetase class 2
MEIYVAYKDYNWMMKFTENLLEHCAVSKWNERSYFGEHKVDFKAPCPRNDDRFYRTLLVLIFLEK